MRSHFYVTIIRAYETNEEPFFPLFLRAEDWGHPSLWCGERFNVALIERFNREFGQVGTPPEGGPPVPSLEVPAEGLGREGEEDPEKGLPP